MKQTEVVSNFKRNWYFPISATAFFCLNLVFSPGYLIGLAFALGISFAFALRIPSVLALVGQNSARLHLVAVLTALGTCWGCRDGFYARCVASSKVQKLEAMLSMPIDIPFALSVLGAAAALFFIYFCALMFWKKMTGIISDNGMFADMNIPERIVYGILIVASLVLVVFSFLQTDAFYGAKVHYDIIYTSDSSALVLGNVYLVLTHGENDLRQPLFAVFAAPFVAVPFLLGKLLCAPASVQAMLLNAVQVVMLFVANFMLAKAMKLNSVRRICFMLLAFFTYTHLLFTLMMEQYIVAYFWLTFCIYLISEKRNPDKIAIYGAGGALLTSMVLLPFMSDKNPVRNFKGWLSDMMKFGLGFIVLLLAFCRFDVIFSLVSKVSFLMGFTGRNLTLTDKIYQYIAFVANCFIAPDAGVNTTAFAHISWQQNPVTRISVVGVVVLLFVIISAILNRDKMSSLLAIGWVFFSIIILLGLGWGTRENGLILYALYFGWAFFVLLFQLVEKLEDKLKVKFLVPAFSAGVSAILAAINIPAIMELVNFAITWFPA